MPVVTLNFGEQVDMLDKTELRAALAEDAALRAVLTGVKSVDQFFNAGAINPAAPGGLAQFVTPVNMIAGGLVWTVLNLGFECSGAAIVRVYKGTLANAVPATPVGFGRFVGQTISLVTPSLQFAKGQLMLRAGDQLTLLALGAPTILSLFLTATEVPAERIGELLL